MKPRIVERSDIIITEAIGTGNSVNDIDIAALWDRFIVLQPNIKHQIKGKSNELHIEEGTSPRMHFCLVGNEVKKIETLPVEIFTKALPEGMYPLFPHHFSNGSFSDAFTAAHAWLEASELQALHMHLTFNVMMPGPKVSRFQIL